MKDKKTTLLKYIQEFVTNLKADTGEEKPAETTEVKLATMKLDDDVTVLEADAFEAGNSVMILTEDEQRIPLPVNEEGYPLEDGRLLIVKEEGVIDSIVEKPAEEGKPAETPAETQPVAQTDAPTALPVAKKVVEAVTRESHFSKEELTEISDSINTMLSKMDEVDPKDAEIERLKAEITELKAVEDEVPAEKPITHNPESKDEGTINLSEVKQGGLTTYLNNRK